MTIIVPIEWAEIAKDTLDEKGFNIEFVSYPIRHTLCLEEIEKIALWLKTISK